MEKKLILVGAGLVVSAVSSNAFELSNGWYVNPSISVNYLKAKSTQDYASLPSGSGDVYSAEADKTGFSPSVSISAGKKKGVFTEIDYFYFKKRLSGSVVSGDYVGDKVEPELKTNHFYIKLGYEVLNGIKPYGFWAYKKVDMSVPDDVGGEKVVTFKSRVMGVGLQGYKTVKDNFFVFADVNIGKTYSSDFSTSGNINYTASDISKPWLKSGEIGLGYNYKNISKLKLSLFYDETKSTYRETGYHIIDGNRSFQDGYNTVTQKYYGIRLGVEF